METLTPQQVRRVCTADTLSALASDLQTVGADPAGLTWSVMCCTVWYGSITGAHRYPYIHYYNRAAVLTCTASGVAVVSSTRWRCCGAVMRSSVAQVVYSRLVRLLYCVRWNRSNQRKRHCKALCAVLQRGRYICIDGRKAVVNVCMGLYCNRTKQKPCTLSRCKAKEKPGHC